MTAPSLNRQFIEECPMVWFETSATVKDRHNHLINHETTPPLKANYLQLTETEVLDWMEANGYPGRIVKMKGRRQGSSTGTLARMVHRMKRKSTSGFICGLDHDRNVKTMEEIFWRFADTDLHTWTGNVTGKPLKGKGGHFTNGSKLMLYSANSGTSGRGDGAQFGLFTEVAWYPTTEGRNENDLFVALFQLVPREPGTEIILESTPNGEGGKFHSTWIKSVTFEELKEMHAGKRRFPKDWNNFVRIFQAWHEFPDYILPDDHFRTLDVLLDIENGHLTDSEKELVRLYNLVPGRLAWRRDVLATEDFDGDEDLFRSEYPDDDVSCFISSGAKYFDWQRLKEMKEYCRPGEHGILRWTDGSRETLSWFEPKEERDSWVRIFERPEHGRSYIGVLDPMTGEQANGKDPDSHFPAIIRVGYFTPDGAWVPPALVARLADCGAELRAKANAIVCRWELDLLEERKAMLLKWYGNCPDATEMNKDLGVVELQKKRGNINIYRRREWNKLEREIKEVYGWMTTTATRPAILEPLKARIAQYRAPGAGRLSPEWKGKGIDIWDIRVVSEFQHFVNTEKGKPVADASSHDDSVMGMAIAGAVEGCATPYVDRQAVREAYYEDVEAGRGRHRDTSWG